MRIVLQRVKQAKVQIDNQTVGAIDRGLLIFLGIAKGDGAPQVDKLAKKVVELRIFEDAAGKMNLSALDVSAQLLVVSQFTLYGHCDKGRRPSFDEAGDPQMAEGLYDYFVRALKKNNITVAAGRFGAMMEVSLINDGPVTFILESNGDH